jgi:hypothetical protein
MMRMLKILLGAARRTLPRLAEKAAFWQTSPEPEQAQVCPISAVPIDITGQERDTHRQI